MIFLSYSFISQTIFSTSSVKDCTLNPHTKLIINKCMIYYKQCYRIDIKRSMYIFKCLDIFTG